MTAEKVDHRIE